MTPQHLPRMLVVPSIRNILSNPLQKLQTVYVESTLVPGERNKAGIKVESSWGLDYESKRISLSWANLLTRFDKIPLTPLDIPDRHLRTARRIGKIVFDLRRLDNLELFGNYDPGTVLLATREREEQHFLRYVDAELWCLQIPETDRIPINIKAEPVNNRSVLREAQMNSASMRADTLRLMIQAVIGVGAARRIRTLIERGLSPAVFEQIWSETHEHEGVPESLKNILYQE